jgi:hypothetical protein
VEQRHVPVDGPVIELLPRSDGARRRRLTLSHNHDGGLVLTWHEMGAASEAPWTDDEEVTLEVPKEQLATLALALAEELFRGRTDAVPRLVAICEAHDIEHRVALWS